MNQMTLRKPDLSGSLERYIYEVRQIPGPLTFAQEVQYLAMDTISTITFGRTSGFMDDHGNLFDYIKTKDESLLLMQLLACCIGCFVSSSRCCSRLLDPMLLMLLGWAT